jgi:hypothetical protein
MRWCKGYALRIDAVRCRRLSDPAYLAIAAAVATVSWRAGGGRYGGAAALNRATRKGRGYLYSESVGSNSAVRTSR